MPELLMDMGPNNTQPPSVNDEISGQGPPAQQLDENEDHDRKLEEPDAEHGNEEHRNNDKFCCHIL